MVVEFAMSTRHHKISTKVTNEMGVLQIELIFKRQDIKWLLIDKSAFYKYEKTCILACRNLRQSISFFFFMNT